MRLVGVVISGFWLALAAPAAAQHSLDFPLECGSAREFEAAVARRLGEIRLPPTQARIERDAEGYRLSMSVGGEQRELRDRNCSELFRAAVVVAVAIAVSEDAPTSERPAAPPAVPPPRRTEPATPVVVQGTTAEPAALRAFVELGGGVTSGTAPGVVPSLELEAKLFVHRFGAALAARYVTLGSSKDGANRGVEVSAAGVALCGLFQPLPALETRLGVQALRASGTGIGSASQQSDVAWAGGLVAGVAFFPVQHERFWLGAAAQAEWHVVRARFEILNYREVFRMPSVGGSASARFGFRFF